MSEEVVLDSVSIELWLDKRQLAALEQALTEDGTTVERTMQEQLNELYAQRVPLEQQEKIQQAWMPSGLKASETLKPVPGMQDSTSRRTGRNTISPPKAARNFGYGNPHATLCARHMVTKKKGFARCIYGAEEISPAV